VASVEVRDADDRDLPALRDVFRRSSWSNEADRPLLEQHPEFLEFSGEGIRDGRTRLAEVDGRVVGFSSIVDGGSWWELEDLFVDPDWMGRGVGRALVVDLVERAGANGVVRVEVDANDHALDFYRRVGFVEGERVALDHGTAVRMTLDVRSASDSATG
jgi:GNAT superfamily N-acetyltransferase